MIRIGIDVGGTNTDAAIMEDDRIVLSFRATSSTDVTTGITEALSGVLEKSVVDPKSIDVVALGTTHFTNAVVQRRDLTPTAAIRLGPPRRRRCRRWWIGGMTFGRRLAIMRISRMAATSLTGARLRRSTRTSFARSRRTSREGKFARSPSARSLARSTGRRTQGREILAEAPPGADITVSSNIGRVGLLERENAGVMNACLRDLPRAVIGAFRKALDTSGVSGSRTTAP